MPSGAAVTTGAVGADAVMRAAHAVMPEGAPFELRRDDAARPLAGVVHEDRGAVAQVVGRSGRHKPGEVVIQTMAPHHAAIRSVAEHDDDSFYAAEAEFRRLTKYPPFGALARLMLVGDDEKTLFAAADRLAGEIRPENSADMFQADASEDVALLGPAVPSLSKIENEFRVHFLIKAANEKSLRAYLKRIKPLIDRFENSAVHVRAILDIDPRELM
mgnify:CR=1 FL=1